MSTLSLWVCLLTVPVEDTPAQDDSSTRAVIVCVVQASAHRSPENRMSVKRKSVPQLESMQTQEGMSLEIVESTHSDQCPGPRPLFVDLEDRDGDENMSSSTSSIEEGKAIYS